MKKDWAPTQGSFQDFLHWLDQGVDSGGEKYLEMHLRLLPTLIAKIASQPTNWPMKRWPALRKSFREKGEITELSPAHYCYVTAKFVFLEYLRHARHGRAGLDEFSVSGQPGSVPAAAPLSLENDDDQEKLLSCLDRCLNKLSAADSELILEYYQGEKHEKIERRRELGARLGLSANALSIRACRIRTKVEQCVKDCCKNG